MAEDTVERYRVIALSKEGSLLQDDKTKGATEAWTRARSQSLDADTQTIRIIDADDCIVAEWDKDKGVVYPPELTGRRFPPFRTNVRRVGSEP